MFARPAAPVASAAEPPIANTAVVTPAGGGLTPQAFLMLLVLACMFGANHVAARLALDHGVNVPTAVAVRSLATALVVGGLVLVMKLRWQLAPGQRPAMALVSLLVAVQSACLYSAVARIPVGLALLAFNTYPLWTAGAAWALYGHRPERRVLMAMPLILAGLALALDVSGATAGLGAAAQWERIGTGVLLALAAGAAFGLVLAVTQHRLAGLDGRVRTALTMSLVGGLALIVTLLTGGPHWPVDAPGWWGLALLSLLYGTAFTLMFNLLPRLGVVGNSPILNVEPVAALLMASAFLGQQVATVQWLGAFVVVGTVMALGLRRRR